MTKLEIDHKTIRELFDKDPAFEIEVKNKILNTAIKGRCKSLVNMEMTKAMDGTIKEELAKLIGELEGSGWSKVIKLTVKMKNAIKSEAKKIVKSQVIELVRTAQNEAQEEVESRVEYFKKIIQAYMDKQFNEGLAEFTKGEIDLHFAALSEEIRKRK